MDQVTLDVETVVAGGDGLARDAEGRVVFVGGALPGERVEADVVQRRKDFSRATTTRVVVASPHRIEAVCAHVSEGCGGCDWQHVDLTGQREMKASIVVDALRRQAHVDVEVDPGPTLGATGHRTTLRGVAVGGRFGFRQRSSHDVVRVDPCLVAHPLLQELITDGRFPDGEVVLRAGARTGERLVVVAGDPTAVVLPPDVRVVSDAQLRSGKRAWYHEQVAGRRWRISARSFFQARPDGAEALVDLVTQALDGALTPAAHLVDLYGGVGLFAGSLAEQLGDAGHVTLVEQGASSVADARVNLADLQAKIIKADVAHWGSGKADVVVADPPRAGLGPKGVGAVVGSGAGRLALVSCDAASLGRDTRLLANAGYSLVGATLLDLFPHTSHVEVVSRYERG